MRYQLTARLGDRLARVSISAPDSFDAMMQAIEIIIRRADKAPNGPWALGRIELYDSLGRRIHTMDAKAPA